VVAGSGCRGQERIGTTSDVAPAPMQRRQTEPHWGTSKAGNVESLQCSSGEVKF
jgi:hypothetical protein